MRVFVRLATSALLAACGAGSPAPAPPRPAQVARPAHASRAPLPAPSAHADRVTALEPHPPCTLPDHLPPITGRVWGRVCDAHDHAAGGASVVLGNTIVIADPNGVFQLDAPAGDYRIYIYYCDQTLTAHADARADHPPPVLVAVRTCR